MNKELEALKRMAEYRFEEYGVERDDGTSFDEDFEIVKQALQRLEQIDNAKPSEALLIYINTMICRNNKYIADDKGVPQLYINDNEVLEKIKQALLKAQEQEKVLNIIKEKTVNILLLELAENVDEYNERIVPNGQLTKEEFDLLKRWSGNGSTN